ncbi:MAG: hypothetical protein AAF264_05350 [Pseudomonadota bacterium]
MRTFSILVVAAFAIAPAVANAQGGSWICGNQMDMDRDEARALAGTNNALFNIILVYRERWDNRHMRAQCEAYAAGQPYEISCLDGRRDWEAIGAMVPDEFFGMSSPELTPHFHEIQDNYDEIREVITYCRDVGAIE